MQINWEWGTHEIIDLGSAVIGVIAMTVAIVHARHAKDFATQAERQADQAKRQADAALGEIRPLIFLDGIAFKNASSCGGHAALTLINHNRPDVRLLEIEIDCDPAIVVSVDTGELRNVIAAAFQHSRREQDGPMVIDFRDDYHVIPGNSIGTVANRFSIPLDLTRSGRQNYTQDTATISATVRYLMLDAQHSEEQINVSAIVPFRRG
jgi:hypothetical protein